MHVRELHKQTSCSLSNGSDGGSFLGDVCPVFPQTGPEVMPLSSDNIPIFSPSMVFLVLRTFLPPLVPLGNAGGKQHIDGGGSGGKW